MNTQEILNADKTKTWKIQQLILLGLTRTEIANLVTNGNYGFVQNVYAKMKAQGLLSVSIQLAFEPTAFDRKFGIEIEGYGVASGLLARKLREAGIECYTESYNHNTRGHWKIVHDGSLSGANTFEIVSPILEGQEGIEQVRKVCEVLEGCNVKINKSCGLHVHFDATNITVEHTKNILKNYGAYEEQIDSFLPISRRANNNTYCKSVKRILPDIEQATTIQRIAQIMGSRYFKINLQSYTRHNTIEFRQHSGTVEFEKISNWIIFLHNLVSYSISNLPLQTEEITIESLKKFNQASVFNYIIRRQNQLNS